MPPKIIILSSDEERDDEAAHTSASAHRPQHYYTYNILESSSVGMPTVCSLDDSEYCLGDPTCRSSSQNVPTSAIGLSDYTSGLQSDEDRIKDDVEVDADVQMLDEARPESITPRNSTLALKPTIQFHVPKSTLIHPRSAFLGFVPPAKELDELYALKLLKPKILKIQTNRDYLEIGLDNFSVYTASKKYPSEFKPLQKLAAGATAINVLYFDGIINIGSESIFLRKVPFKNLPIDGYDDATDTVADKIWIQSMLCEKQRRHIYYRLLRPAPEYARFFEPFLWIADLAKHFIDFCAHYQSENRRVVLNDLKETFSAYITSEYRHSAVVQQWHRAHRSTDFRSAVVANVEYVWKEANAVTLYDLSWHPIWSEIKDFNRYRPNLPTTTAALGDVPKTVVTPYIRNLFGHMVFGSVFETIPLSSQARAARISQAQSCFTNKSFPPSTQRSRANQDNFITSIQVGDVISTNMDDATTKTNWKLEPSIHHEENHVWLGLVQKVQIREKHRYFDVLWLYHPRDTSCSKMKYPWKNELFLSDNCTCHSRYSRIQADEVIATHDVQWFGDEKTKSEFFVRQIYLPDQNRWEQLRERHLRCTGFSDDHLNFVVGDTVLTRVDKNQDFRLYPVVIESVSFEIEQTMARVRLLRKRPGSPVNELFWTEEFIMLKVKNFQRRCFVRVFTNQEQIPTPYDRGGTGDFFYIRQMHGFDLSSMKQGFDPHEQSTAKLRGLDLFCGGGNFGRGLEEGLAVQMCWANDISQKAMHTYIANADLACKPLLGSVDDLLRAILEGSDSSAIPKPGDVDFVSGGSPCPGFSLLTVDKSSPGQRKNQSLVASFASFVDVLRPNSAYSKT